MLDGEFSPNPTSRDLTAVLRLAEDGNKVTFPGCKVVTALYWLCMHAPRTRPRSVHRALSLSSLTLNPCSGSP